MIFYIIGQVAPKIINLEQRHKGLAEISASLLFFIVSDKRQIRTNRLLPKGSDYFDLVEMPRLELGSYRFAKRLSTYLVDLYFLKRR